MEKESITVRFYKGKKKIGELRMGAFQQSHFHKEELLSYASGQAAPYAVNVTMTRIKEVERPSGDLVDLEGMMDE